MPEQSETQIEIRQATEADLDAIIGLFDESVRWLAERGLEGQWGTTPFSEMPEMRERFREWIDTGEMYVALQEGEMVGTIALSEKAPEYTSPLLDKLPDDALYLEALTTARSRAGSGVGREMLQWADRFAAEDGKTAIWLDCWADNPSLCQYYERAGYEPRGVFGTKWRGQMFEKPLAPAEAQE
jgi:GNAT superfamily N-acetyltransferase